MFICTRTLTSAARAAAAAAAPKQVKQKNEKQNQLLINNHNLYSFGFQTVARWTWCLYAKCCLVMNFFSQLRRIAAHFFVVVAVVAVFCTLSIMFAYSFAQRVVSLMWSYNLQCNQINACFLFVIYILWIHFFSTAIFKMRRKKTTQSEWFNDIDCNGIL